MGLGVGVRVRVTCRKVVDSSRSPPYSRCSLRRITRSTTSCSAFDQRPLAWPRTPTLVVVRLGLGLGLGVGLGMGLGLGPGPPWSW